MYTMILTNLKLLKSFPKQDSYTRENLFHLYAKMKEKQSQCGKDKKKFA